jgi:hypothetical protein
MNRELLNDVKFDKNVKLKRFKKSEYNPEETKTPFSQNMTKLIYFLFLVALLLATLYFGTGYLVGFIHNTGYEDFFHQIVPEFQAIQKED